jgi:putative ABC transport system ATP-binding protein
VTALAPPGVVLARLDGVGVVHGRGPSAVHALNDISLALAEGEPLAIWGRSGSGKTTLLHVLGGIVPPSSGRVDWRATDAARSRVGFVFQGPSLVTDLTALENVELTARLATAGASPGARELLALVGLAGKEDALPPELSGGEAQRVAIARALALRPYALLCDEPTGQLDSGTAGRVLDLLDALLAELGGTLVIATHDAAVAGRAQRIVELADGHLAADRRP